MRDETLGCLIVMSAGIVPFIIGVIVGAWVW